MVKISALALASAVAGAIAIAGSVNAEMGTGQYKCWGVSKAGQNDCANAAKTHDCAGQSKADYDLGEWKAVKDADTCKALGGAEKPGKGPNTNAKM